MGSWGIRRGAFGRSAPSCLMTAQETENMTHTPHFCQALPLPEPAAGEPATALLLGEPRWCPPLKGAVPCFLQGPHSPYSSPQGSSGLSTLIVLFLVSPPTPVCELQTKTTCSAEFQKAEIGSTSEHYSNQQTEHF